MFSVPQVLALLNYPMVSHPIWHELLVNCYAQILNLYHQQVQLFVDCAFNIVPHPFKQCLITVSVAAGLWIYTPVA